MADNPCGIKRWVAVWKDTWGTGCLRQGSIPCLSAINAENQQIAKQTPSFTPKNVKLGVFVLFKIYPSIVSLWTKK